MKTGWGVGRRPFNKTEWQHSYIKKHTGNYDNYLVAYHRGMVSIQKANIRHKLKLLKRKPIRRKTSSSSFSWGLPKNFGKF